MCGEEVGGGESVKVRGEKQINDSEVSDCELSALLLCNTYLHFQDELYTFSISSAC